MLEQSEPDVDEVIDSRTARLMTSMLREVVLHGTAVAVNRLKVPLAGKTGTTNNFTDAWFVGFSPQITCGMWIGFDEKKSLGSKETGARAAVPVWIDFTKAAIGNQASSDDFLPVRQDMVLASQPDDRTSLLRSQSSEPEAHRW